MALTKANLVENLLQKVGLNKRDAKILVDLFFEEIKSALTEGQIVKLSGFGKFNLRDKKPRPGRNPKTPGTEILIAARRVVTFKAGQKLKVKIEKYLGFEQE